MVETLEKPSPAAKREMRAPAREAAAAKTPAPESAPLDPKLAVRAEDVTTPDDILEFLRTYTPQKPIHFERKNQLDGHYTIHIDRPIPELNTTLAKAYAVTDEKNSTRELYAMIGKDGVPVRQRAIKALLGLQHPNMVELVAAGRVELTSPQTIAYALVFTRPRGQTLTSFLREKAKGLPERTVIADMIAPINQVLLAFREKEICHGRIHPDKIYIGERITVGECLSEPCGYSQPGIYEAPERITATPFGKGDGDNYSDVYSLAVLTLHLLRPQYLQSLPEENSLIPHLLSSGPYLTLVRTLEFSDTLTDLFRGALNEKKHERWDSQDVRQWLDGKKYNLIPPSTPRDGARPFTFNKQEFYNGKALAHAFHRNWDMAVTELKTNQLARWIELSMHKPQIAEQIHRVSRVTTTDSNAPAKLNNELVARTIIVLDGTGPMRIRSLAAHIEGLGAAMADYYLHRKQDELGYFTELMESDLHSFWYDQHKDHHSTEISNALFRLHKLRGLMRYTALGFGMERILYDLNPSLPCQSPLVLRYHCMTLEELLLALDHIARDKNKDNTPIDRHIAGFIASRIDLGKEIKIAELASMPHLASHPKLVGLRLLGLAQEKAKKSNLPGLAHWAALEAWPLFESIHNRSMRKRLQADLKRKAQTGQIDQILLLLANTDITRKDTNGFQRAQQRFHRNAARIVALKDKEMHRRNAEQLGHKLSMLVSYVALCATLYIIARQYILF